MTDPLRARILKATHRAQAGHIASSFSCLDIIKVLYERVMREGDTFILSKGHAALALYAVLESHGLLSLDDFGGALTDHPTHSADGVTFTTGSLGHGIALGAGLALGKRINGEEGRVFVLVGDGECQEGSTWEAVDLVAQLSLNVVVIVDDNRTHPSQWAARFEAFGVSAECVKGHNEGALQFALDWCGPRVIIAQTTKGKGIARMETDPGAWHHRAPTEVELYEMLEELEK